MIVECPGLHIELHDLTKRRVTCRRIVQQLCVDEFNDIEIDEVRPIYCDQTCRSDSPDVTLDTTAESEKSRRGEIK